jgi:hypothetical protein
MQRCLVCFAFLSRLLVESQDHAYKVSWIKPIAFILGKTYMGYTLGLECRPYIVIYSLPEDTNNKL